jgi:hypothetical protein
MKPLLMHPDADFDLNGPLPWNETALVADLGLDSMLAVMAGRDPFLLEIARRAVLRSAHDVATIRHRQSVLQDCERERAVVQHLYDLSVEAIERERREYLGILSQYPGAMLQRGLRVLSSFLDLLVELRRCADLNGARFQSPGFRRLFAEIREELSEDFFAEVRRHLRLLRFDRGVLLSARLGQGVKGQGYVLRRTEQGRWDWLWQLLACDRQRAYLIYVHPRDETGARCLSELSDRGIQLVALALAQSADHVLGFFRQLRAELGFYLACLRLRDELRRRGLSLCMPEPLPAGERRFSCRGLYDVGLALRQRQPVIGNDVMGDGKLLLLVTGANQGGKSVFLRSVGVAQLMMQCGMYAPADAYTSDICDGLFTHYKREEDPAMASGKLDEELKRMSEIIDHLTPHAMLLFNESFAATNEREGSEIARAITRALIAKGKKVLFVSHLHDFARSLFNQRLEEALFLRADRRSDGSRTFKLMPGEPLPTSFGEDLYQRILGPSARLDPGGSGA